MRTPIASALLVVFGLVFFAHSAAGQSIPIPSQPQSLQQTPQKPPSNAKLLPLPPATQVPLFPNQAGSANDHIIAPQELKELKGRIGAAINMQMLGGGPDAPNCAHIRIIQAPEMDPEMVVQMSPGDGGPIQTFQGLPPCGRDLPAPMLAQRFYGVPPKAAASATRPVRATLGFTDSIRPTTACTEQARRPQPETMRNGRSR